MLTTTETHTLIEFINKSFGLDLSENLKPIALSELNKFKKENKPQIYNLLEYSMHSNKMAISHELAMDHELNYRLKTVFLNIFKTATHLLRVYNCYLIFSQLNFEECKERHCFIKPQIHS